MTYVEVHDNNGRVNFSSLGVLYDSVQKFPTIQDAIIAVSCLDPNKNFDIILFSEEHDIRLNNNEVLFDELVTIGYSNLSFIGRDVWIRAIHPRYDVSAEFTDGINVGNIINGDKTVLTGKGRYKISHSHVTPPSEAVFLKPLTKTMYSREITAGLIRNYLQTVQGVNVEILWKDILDVTTNFQIALPTFYSNSCLDIFNTKIEELKGEVSETTPPFSLLSEDLDVQESLATMDKTKKRLYDLYRSIQLFSSNFDTFTKTYAPFIRSDSNDIIPPEYRVFIQRYLNIRLEYLFLQQQLLKRLMNINIIKESGYMPFLQSLKLLLVEAQMYLNQLDHYVHQTTDTMVLARGENSSELFLDFAEQTLKSPDAKKFKESLITFLNEKSPTKIVKEGVVKNEDLIASLRKYTKKCPDADYAIIRFIKNHSESWKDLS